MLPAIDLMVLVVYLLGILTLGCWFTKQSSQPSEFMAAGGKLAGWVVGLSIFGTYLSSNTFIGVPGKAFGSNWNFLVFSFSLPLAAWLAVKFFVPFYRRTGEISAYHHLEHRFGGWARTFAVFCYLLTQLARLGSILLGMSLVLAPLTGWNQSWIILGTGCMVTLYTGLGGIEAVIWTDVVQAIVLIIGALAVLVFLLLGLPEGPGQVFSYGMAHDKFSLGTFDLDFSVSSFWVVLLYGIFINLGNFGIDQSYVQRYHTARDDRQAAKSVWWGALLYVPISLTFFHIGTAAFAFYHTHPEWLAQVQETVAREQLTLAGEKVTSAAIAARASTLTDAELGDKILPHYIVHGLPTGGTGLLISAILAAAMSSLSTSVNSSATIVLTDLYRRYWHPQPTDRQAMLVLYISTAVIGTLGTLMALLLIGVESVLEAWWLLAGMFGSGLLGLFLLGMLVRGAGRSSAIVGVLLGMGVVLWMTLSLPAQKFVELPDAWKCPLDGNMIIVVGSTVIVLAGLVTAKLISSNNPPLRPLGEGQDKP
jgi:solute:Na+ symporter, SSS family